MHELSASFLNQVLEIPELRDAVAELVPGIGRPQLTPHRRGGRARTSRGPTSQNQ
jgi:hypothetical protein